MSLPSPLRRSASRTLGTAAASAALLVLLTGCGGTDAAEGGTEAPEGEAADGEAEAPEEGAAAAEEEVAV